MFPRLPLWSAIMLRSFVALDTKPGVNLEFGRLEVSRKKTLTLFNSSFLLMIIHYLKNHFYFFDQPKQMKHITATPFADSIVEPPMQLPDSSLHYIKSRLPSIHNIQVCKSNSEARILVFYLQSSRLIYIIYSCFELTLFFLNSHFLQIRKGLSFRVPVRNFGRQF